MSIKTRQYKIQLEMGKGMGKYGWSQIPELKKKDIENLDTIGYTGKLKDIKMTQGDYLAKLLDKDTINVSAYMSKFDSGDFAEEYTVIISEYKKDK